MNAGYFPNKVSFDWACGCGSPCAPPAGGWNTLSGPLFGSPMNWCPPWGGLSHEALVSNSWVRTPWSPYLADRIDGRAFSVPEYSPIDSYGSSNSRTARAFGQSFPVPDRPSSGRAGGMVDLDLARSQADALHRAMAPDGTDEDAIFRILEGASPEQAREIERVFQENHGEHWNGVGGTLRTALRDELDDSDFDRASLTLDRRAVQDQPGDRQLATLQADLLQQAMAPGGTDEDAIFRVLEEADPGQLQELDRTFRERHGQYWYDEGGDLRGALRDELDDEDFERARRALARR
ncbi:MAG: hypothetical protein HY319_31765 [Armatimonadetes bacterium]|nr:hypothetical protein [Armatimonadota bacterium]